VIAKLSREIVFSNIRSSNFTEKEISMATPVVTMMFPTTGLDVLKNFSQFFFIPSSAGPAPQPIDKSIRIEEVPRKDMYIWQTITNHGLTLL
jgi:hypothetical protein